MGRIMPEWVSAARELGLTLVLAAVFIWLGRWLPIWVDQVLAARERLARLQAEERERDRAARNEQAAVFQATVAELHRQHGERADRLIEAVAELRVASQNLCRYHPTDLEEK